MALRLFLNQEVGQEVVQQLGGRKPVPEYETHPYNGVSVRIDNDGRPYYDVKNDHVPLALLVPPALQGKVDHYSWLVNLWANCPTRQLGLYSHESAEATVEKSSEHGRKFTAHVYGPKLEDVHELMRAIRAGRATLVEGWAWEAEPEVSDDNPALITPPMEDVLALIAEATGNPDAANMSDEEARAYMEMLSSGAEEEANAYMAQLAADPDRQPQKSQYAKIQCHECGARYTINADKTAGKTVKVVCRRCGSHIHVTDGKVVDSAPYSSTRNGQDN